MKILLLPLVAALSMTLRGAEPPVPGVTRDIPYTGEQNERLMLDVYAPAAAKNLPVIFWIHGGGWQKGDKSEMDRKPQAFTDAGFVFVATNYRFLPGVEMRTILSDVAKAIRWVHGHIAEHGGDSRRIIVMGHSAGAQLAALVCTDERYLKAEGLPLSAIRACVPVDGDTYDVTLQVETGAARRRSLGQPEPKFGHREKFGGADEMLRDLSAVYHVARGKGIPPFLLVHVGDHPDKAAQTKQLQDALTEVGLPVKTFAAPATDHVRINANLGQPDDPATKAVLQFLAEVMSEKQ
jgi:arylformamidase